LGTSPNQIFGPLVDEIHGEVIFSYYFVGDFLYDITSQSIQGGPIRALPAGNYVYFVDSSNQRVIYCIAATGPGSGVVDCRSVNYNNSANTSNIFEAIPWTNIFVDGTNGILFVSVQNSTYWALYLVSTVGSTPVLVDSGNIPGGITGFQVDSVNQILIWAILNPPNAILKSASYAGGTITTTNILDTSHTISILGIAPTEKYVFYSTTDTNAVTSLKVTDTTGQGTPFSIQQGVGLNLISVAVDEQQKALTYATNTGVLTVYSVGFSTTNNINTTSNTVVTFLYFVIVIPIVVFLILLALVIGAVLFVVKKKEKRRESQFF